jgi:hypothetical protein
LKERLLSDGVVACTIESNGLVHSHCTSRVVLGKDPLVANALVFWVASGPRIIEI